MPNGWSNPADVTFVVNYELRWDFGTEWDGSPIGAEIYHCPGWQGTINHQTKNQYQENDMVSKLRKI